MSPTDAVESTCPEESVYIPGCSEEFPVCFPEEMLCDRIADCVGAPDEVPSRCGNGICASVSIIILWYSGWKLSPRTNKCSKSFMCPLHFMAYA